MALEGFTTRECYLQWQKMSLKYIDDIAEELHIHRQRHGRYEIKEGEWGAHGARDRYLFGDLRFLDSKVKSSHLVPIGDPEPQRAVLDTFHNNTDFVTPYTKEFEHGETHRKLSQKSFNAGLRTEIEQSWEVGGEATQSKVSGKFTLETTLNWGTVSEDEYTQHALDKTTISVTVPAGEEIEVSQHREKTKMRVDLETFYVFDVLIGFGGWEHPHGSPLYHSADRHEIHGKTDLLMMSKAEHNRNGIDDLYEILSGISPRYPHVKENYLEHRPKVRAAYEWFKDESNRSMVVKDTYEIENGYSSTAELRTI